MVQPLAPRHPLLRPGVRVVRRDRDHLQIGVGQSAVVAADTPEVRALLASLEAAQPVEATTPAARACWAALLERGQLIDADAYFHELPPAPRAQQARSAMFAHHPADAPWRLAARSRAGIAVLAERRMVDLAAQARELLSLAGIRMARREPSAALVLVGGEIRRARLDPLLQAGTPHLLITESEGVVRLGPFVEPGTTACLRCIDAALSERDPRRALIVEQLAGRSGPGPVAPPHDPALRLLALSLAVVDLTAYVDGDRPLTWSTTIDVMPDLALARTPWKRHPRCGCTWGNDLPVAAVG
jgi:bacteriocin biosynthesis cyclodehydratase domain-containing protein